MLNILPRLEAVILNTIRYLEVAMLNILPRLEAVILNTMRYPEVATSRTVPYLEVVCRTVAIVNTISYRELKLKHYLADQR